MKMDFNAIWMFDEASEDQILYEELLEYKDDKVFIERIDRFTT